jgi:hypothetical protein
MNAFDEIFSTLLGELEKELTNQQGSADSAENALKSEVQHGQLFDNNKRWCWTCTSTVSPTEPTENFDWAQTFCPVCYTLWPEYTQLVLEQSRDPDSDFHEFNRNMGKVH